MMIQEGCVAYQYDVRTKVKRAYGSLERLQDVRMCVYSVVLWTYVCFVRGAALRCQSVYSRVL